jgi:ABC-2 type transport system permease protein
MQSAQKEKAKGGKSILYRGAGIDVVYPQFVIVELIGSLFLGLSIMRFHSVTLQAS